MDNDGEDAADGYIRRTVVASARTGTTRRGGNRRRVLFLTCHLPWPPISGGRRRDLELVSRLSARFDLHLLVISKTPAEDARNREAVLPFCHRVEVLPVDASIDAEAAPAISPIRRHRCQVAAGRIAAILQRGEIDLVHVEGFYLLQHLPERLPVPLLLVEQNVEYELERQRSVATKPTDSIVSSYEFTRAAELDCWRRADLLAAVTSEDRERMCAALPGADVRVVPDGADHLPPAINQQPTNRRTPHRPPRPSAPLLALVGNFAYAPNVDAALYFYEDILPLIRDRLPDVHLWLVGNAPPSEMRCLASDRVLVTGLVPDLVPYIDAADVIVCPLRIGGGIKLKTIEALRRGKVLVTTRVGAQGLPTGLRDALVVIDDPKSFARATARLLVDSDWRSELEHRATLAASSLSTWDEAAAALADIYDELLAGAPLAEPEAMIDAAILRRGRRV